MDGDADTARHEMKSGWPRYVPMVFATGTNVSPQDLERLNQAMLPESAFEKGNMLKEPVGLEVPNCRYVIRFADCLYYEPSTGEVLMIAEWPGAKPCLVNSTLEQLGAIVDGFPYYDDLDEEIEALPLDNEERQAAEERYIEQRTAAAIKLRDCFEEIDPVAMVFPSFWGDNLLLAMEWGHYSTAEVLKHAFR